MTVSHAVTWIDHQNAQVLQFDDEHVKGQKIKTHSHHTAQHGSGVRSEHEFFAHVCDALSGIDEVMAAGPRTGLAAFEHYVRKHRPQLVASIVAYQVVDRLTENQLVALGREFFAVRDDGTGASVN